MIKSHSEENIFFPKAYYIIKISYRNIRFETWNSPYAKYFVDFVSFFAKSRKSVFFEKFLLLNIFIKNIFVTYFVLVSKPINILLTTFYKKEKKIFVFYDWHFLYQRCDVFFHFFIVFFILLGNPTKSPIFRKKKDKFSGLSKKWKKVRNFFCVGGISRFETDISIRYFNKMICFWKKNIFFTMRFYFYEKFHQKELC